MAIIGCGLTLVGATTYFFATRYVRRVRAAREAKRLYEEEEGYVDFYDELSDDEDYRAHISNGRRYSKRPPVYRPSPLITFAELYEQAQLLHI